ncbi:MAG: hypothetical protein PHR30_03120 [Gallionellaceae bacterium]|nr:hypothetical protein [Gallionellaceae bacterium]MDD5364303.1 hypothetical protein [Gallionellaceae bacterium]
MPMPAVTHPAINLILLAGLSALLTQPALAAEAGGSAAIAVSPAVQQAIKPGSARIEHLDQRVGGLHFTPAIVVEVESLLPHIVTSAGTAEQQAMAGFGAGWGGGAQVFWRPPAPVDTPIRNWPNLRLYPQVAKAGRYRVTLVHTVAPDYGTVRVFLKGQPVKDYDGYAAGVTPRRLELGEFKLNAGSFELLFTVFSKNAGSSNYYVGLDRLELVPVE